MARLNRRSFLQQSAGLYIAERASASTGACTAYVGFGDESSGGIHVYTVRGGSWHRIQTISAKRPSYLLISPDERFLFAANDVEHHDGLPRGTVESFRIEKADGKLARVSTVGLSLSATGPRHVISTSNSLVVAAHTGGSYNVLDFDSEGNLRGPRHIFKEVGCGSHSECQSSAHPHSLVSDSAGHVIATDFGSDRISVFELRDGRLRRAFSTQTQPGDGPGPIILTPDRSLVYVLNLLSGSISVYSYAAETHTLGKELDRWYIPSAGQRTLVGGLFLDGKNDRVIASVSSSRGSTLALWSKRDRAVTARLPATSIHSFEYCPSTSSLLALDQAQGRILSFDQSFNFERVATTRMPLSLVMRSSDPDRVLNRTTVQL